MREVIVFGKPEHIRVFCKDMQQEIMNIAKQHGLRPRLKEAVDPFFLGESRGKMLLQKLKKLKYEIVLPIGRRSMVAVASTNDHEDFFTSRMRIHASSGDQLGSACVAFGLERWAAAFIAEHGARTSSWPYSVRKFLHQHYAVRK